MKTLKNSFLFLILLLSIGSCGDKTETKKDADETKTKPEIKTAQLYSKAYGESSNPAVVFLHGGPGYNSAGFEATTAQRLADSGFYVIVYDRRGEGRSIDKNAAYNFEQTFDDLKSLYEKYGFEKAILIGHSYGGVVATLFAEKYPENINSLFLVGAPVSMQETFRTIIKTCKSIYTQKKDDANLKYIDMLEKMDTSSIEYSSYCFGHAMQNGFYSPTVATEEALAIYATFNTDTLLKNHAMKMTREGPEGFWKNENYTTIDLTKNIRNLVAKGMKIYALYGKDDGLYSTEQVKFLEDLIGLDNLKYLDNCSHNVFVDCQSEFIDALKNWSK
jgi:proline iminopeptidase